MEALKSRLLISNACSATAVVISQVEVSNQDGCMLRASECKRLTSWEELALSAVGPELSGSRPARGDLHDSVAGSNEVGHV